jgi:Tol biopolymer transport system component
MPLFVASPGLGNQDLYALAASGRVVNQVTRHPPQGVLPAWGARGRIYFTSYDGVGYRDTWRVDSKTGAFRLVAKDAGPVSLSPRRDRLALTVDRGVLFARADGSIVSRVKVGSRVFDFSAGPASWSPDGTRVAIRGDDRRGVGGVFVGATDRAAWRRVTRKPSKFLIENGFDDYWDLGWSPDGGRIVFSLGLFEVGVPPNVRTVRAEGGGERTIGYGDLPVWSPSGRVIAYSPATGKSGRRGVAVVHNDGSGRRFLGNPPGMEMGLAWSADDKTIVVATGSQEPSGRVFSARLYAGDSRRPGFRRLRTNELRRLAPLVGSDEWARDGRGFTSSDGQAISVLWASGKSRQVTAPAEDAQPTRSPDGAAIAFARRRGETVEIVVSDSRGRRARVLATGSGPAWSSDSKLLAYEQGGEVRVIGRSGGNAHTIARGRSPRWSPIGRDLAFLDEHERVAVASIGDEPDAVLGPLVVGGPPPKPAFCDFGRDVSSPSWSPDATRITFGWSDCETTAQIVDARNGSVAASIEGLRRPTWSPDGLQLAGVDEEGEVLVLRTDGSNVRRLGYFDDPDGTYSWSPDGRQLAFDRYQNEKTAVVVANANGSGFRVLGRRWRHPVWATMPAFEFASA